MNTIQTLSIFENYEILEDAKASAEKLPPEVLMRIRGPFQVEDEENQNKRIYPSSLWDAVFKDKDWTLALINRGILGETKHPQDGGQLDRTSHVVSDLKRETINGRKLIIGEADILDTPAGNVMATLFRAGVRIGISSRGMGSSKEVEGKTIIQDDYRPIAWDFVPNPSVKGAFPEVVSESLIVDALSNFVKSTDDKDVLKVILEIVGSLNTNQCMELCENIKSKLEVNMDKKNVPEDQDIWLMVQNLSEAKIKELTTKYDTEIADLKTQIVDLNSKNAKIEKEYKIAEDLIDEFLRKIEDAKNSRVDVEELEATRKLAETAIEKLQETVEFEEKYYIAEELLQEMLDQLEASRVKAEIESVTKDIKDEKLLTAVTKTFSGCNSLEDAKIVKESLADILSAKKLISKTDPLPLETDSHINDSNNLVNEDLETDKTDYISEQLWNCLLV